MFFKIFSELVIIFFSIQSILSHEISHKNCSCSKLQIKSGRKDIEKIKCINMDINSKEINKNLLCHLPNLKEINLKNNKIDNFDLNIGN